jgi:Ca2+-dependent lipid-binding protein
MCEVYRAEGLIPIDFSSKKLDTYVKVSYGGIWKKTKTVSKSSNPVYD